MKKPCYNHQFHRYEIIWANKDGSCGGVWGETEELCLERYNMIKRSDPMIEINTPEVKEVDLEAELNKWRHDHFHGRRDKDASGEYLERISQLELAKYFFELGIKAQAYGERQAFETGTERQKEQMMANTADATIGLPYENKDGGYTHLVDVSRPLPVGNNKIAIIFKED